MSLTITVAALKGGAGKTTLAVALAEVAARQTGGRVLLIDTDSQGSALAWSARSEDAGQPFKADAVGILSPNLADRLPTIAGTYDLVVIDTPPGSDRMVTSALEVADLAILPTRPTLADLDRLWPTFDRAEKARTRALVVLTQARLRTRSLDAAREALQAGGATVARSALPMREDIARNFGTLPAGTLATVATDLLAEAFEMMAP